MAATLRENRRADYRDLFERMSQYNVVAQQIDGRRIRVGDQWVIDFASCNYLGLDLDRQTMARVDADVARWGVHPSWCRLVASPAIYDEVEQRLAALVGTETTMILPTVTLISIGVIPALVGKGGVMLLDRSSHETMYEAAKIARDSGATLRSYHQGDLAALRALLVEHADNPRTVIIVDGVYSMTGDHADVQAIQRLAVEFDALVYVDDAHGFGVVGQDPSEGRPYGHRGNGIVRHLGLTYENLLYVGGCSKAYSSLAAFIACSHRMRAFLQAVATPYDLSGPCPTASLATLLSGLDINDDRGDFLRDELHRLTRRTIDGLMGMGLHVLNETGFPIVSVWVGDSEALVETANTLFEDGILVTVAPYPMVPRGTECHRITLTAANTDAEVDTLLVAFEGVRDRMLARGLPLVPPA